MIFNIFFYTLILLLPILRRLIKKEKVALLIYYILFFILLVIFYKPLFIENEDVNKFFAILQGMGITLIPLLYYFSIKENVNIIKLVLYIFYYFLYPLAIISKIYLIYKFGWFDGLSASFGADVILSMYIISTTLFLLPAIVYDRFK